MYRSTDLPILLLFLFSFSFAISDGEKNVSFSQKNEKDPNCNTIDSLSIENAFPELKKKIKYIPPEWTNYRQDDPNINFSEKSDRHKKFVRMFEKMKEEDEIISDPNIGDRLIWGLDDNLTRVYYLMVILDRGDIATRIDALNCTYFVNIFKDQYPVIYTDINGVDHIITKKWFIECIKLFLENKDSYIQVKSSTALIGLGYFDDKIFSILKYYANNTNIDSWDVKNSIRYRSYFSNNKKIEAQNGDPDLESNIISKCKEDLQFNSVAGLALIEDKKYTSGIRNIFLNILETSKSDNLKKSIHYYLQKIDKKGTND